MTPLHDLPATELLAAYRNKALSPVEVTRSVLAHMHRWEPHLRATWAIEGDRKKERRGQKEGKKGSGLPFLYLRKKERVRSPISPSLRSYSTSPVPISAD